LRENSFCEIVAEAAANALERAHLFESIQKANERLEYLAITDGLTSLKTHRFFMQAVDGEWRRSPRSGKPFSLIMMDLDGFKQLNERQGHLVGDKVLTAVAPVLTAPDRTPWRYGETSYTPGANPARNRPQPGCTARQSGAVYLSSAV
jgi:PleD family two-component response regulator